jgi:UDP-glucuronate 4-epimerase
MSILITGGAGFIAKHLATRLFYETNDNIFLLDNFNDGYAPALKRNNIACWSHEPRVTVLEADFCNADYCRDFFSRIRPRIVVHLGASPGVPLSLERPLQYVQNNITGTTVLLDLVRQFPVERFIFASSSTVYGLGTQPPFVEDAPLSIPASPYGATKRAGEILGQTYHQLFGVPFTAVRLFNAYGPYLRPDLALHIFTRKILAGEALSVYGDGTILRDFTHVHDICTGLIAAFTAPEIAGECINLGHNKPIEIRYLISLIEQAVGKTANVQQLAPRAGDMLVTCADLSKSQRLLGYAPTVSIEQGVSEYVDWLRAHAHLY